MVLTDLSMKRPVLATVINALMVAFGLFAVTQLPLREAPDIDPPIVSVDTNYTGAAADIVENKVTRVIEDEISGIEGIRTIESVSSDGRSRITVEFNLERDIDAAANDIRDRVSRVLDRLPDEADPPDISKADADAQPIMWLTMTSQTMSSLELFDFADRQLIDRLSAIDGVSRVRLGGEQRYAMRIWLDRRAMAARNIAVTDIEQALRRENVELPAGRLESATRDFTIRTARAYQTPEDFRALVLARGDDGYLVRLRDIARVELGAEEEDRLFRANGKPAAGLGIIKQSQANTLSVANGVRAELDKIKALMPEGTEIDINTDYSVYIQESLNEVSRTLAITALLVILIIFLFLGEIRPTLIPAVTVPISLIGSFILVSALGFSINVLTLLALVLAIGLVVDDSIVVLENIYRRIERGEPPLLAAYRGGRQVGFAIVATTLVLVAVLAPIALVPGNVGRLFTEFALALAAAVGVSSIVALTLAPVLASRLLRRREEADKPWLRRVIERGNTRLTDGYRSALAWALAHRFGFVALCLALIAAIGALLARVPSEFAPTEDRGAFFVFLTAPEGSSFDYTSDLMGRAETELMRLHDQGLATRIIAIAPSFGGNRNNSGFLLVTMADWNDRDITTQETLLKTYRDLQKIPGARMITMPRPGLGQGRARGALQVVIGGNDYDELAMMRDAVMAKLEENDRIFSIDSDYKETDLQLRVDVDRDRAATLGVPIENIGLSLESLLGGRQVTTFVDRGEEYDVIVQARRSDRETATDLRNIYVRSETTGELIPLANVVRLYERAGATELPRFNRMRAITVSASLAPGYPLSEAMAYVEEAAQDILTPGSRLDYKGEGRDFADSANALAMAFALSLLVAYLVLAAQFESFIHPAVIMVTVPLAAVAALFALWVAGMTLNIYSNIGIIMLIGLAAKNGILIVEFVNQLRDKGVAFQDAIIEASSERLRPILMTALSTAMGAIPLVLASGAGSEARATIGAVVFAGVLFSAMLTLFVVPVFYDLLARRTSSPGAQAEEIDRLDRLQQRIRQGKPAPEPGE